MLENNGWKSWFGFPALGKEIPEPVEGRSVYKLKELEVKVDLHPIGGYRGKAGILTIDHVQHKVFTDWNAEDLETLAQLTQLILKIHEEAQVHNTLIFARQDQGNDKEQFKLSLIPYPKCHWIEKIQGFIHIIFGSPSLTKVQAQEIAEFYQTKFLQKRMIPEADGEHREGKPDPFCRPEVIENQKIIDLKFGKQHYHLLHDNRPRGNHIQDPHFLVIPAGDQGHCDGSQVLSTNRLNMLKIVQKSMQIFRDEGYSTSLYLERNGSQLQGIQHKSNHILGIREFPKSFFAKFKALILQIYIPVLSQQDLKERIQHYQQYVWQ